MVAELDEGAGKKTVLVRSGLGLSAKILLLFIPLVLASKLVFYGALMASFRFNSLENKFGDAVAAVLVLESVDQQDSSRQSLEHVLLRLDIRSVVVVDGESRKIVAQVHPLPEVRSVVDLQSMAILSVALDGLAAMAGRGDDVVRVAGVMPDGRRRLEVEVDEALIRSAMRDYAPIALAGAVLLSLISAAVAYLAIHLMFARPMGRVARNIVEYHANPKSPARINPPTMRGDEIGLIERELRGLQHDLVETLHQHSRLVSLGLAVSKISHDLRNLLAASQMITEQLVRVPDPQVQRFAPRLTRSLERAISLCQATLQYGMAQEAPPERRFIVIKPFLHEVWEAFGAQRQNVDVAYVVEDGLGVHADPDQLFRVMMNLVASSLDAFQNRLVAEPEQGLIVMRACRLGSAVSIEVQNTGPAIMEYARAHQFDPFANNARSSGAGLGLAIAAELVRAHGGDIFDLDLERGRGFRIVIPDQPDASGEALRTARRAHVNASNAG